MTYPEAIAWLASLEPHVIRPGLDRIRALLARLGDPQAGFRSVLVAGTNGKGSVTACLASILREAGHRPGVYTSPHLVRFEERIAVGGESIAGDDVAALAGEVRDAIDAIGAPRGANANGSADATPTYFEATTALAFLHFRRRGVPIALLEVGMGGRFDATNVVDPILCAITPVALDHTDWLGRTLAAIAYQKAGILRPRVPVAVGRQEAEALEVIRAEAARVGAPIALTGDCRVQETLDAGGRPADPPVFTMTTPDGARYADLAPALRGVHQIDNAAIAVLLAERLAAAGFGDIDAGSIGRGLSRVVWPGRIELIPGQPAILLDGAHNPAGCRSLADYLRRHHAGRRKVLVFAVMHDKRSDLMLDVLCPLFDTVITTAVPVARGESPGTLARLAADRHPRTLRADAAAEAIAAARGEAGPEGLVVVAGSLYLVGEIKKLNAR
jgi:dihydrofolate synthase/folylpolyglutamate synthase